MVRGPTLVRWLAQSSLIRWCKDISTVLGFHRCHPINLVLAEASIHDACSEGWSYIRVLSHAGRGTGSILGSCVSILGWFGLPVGLLHRCTGFMVASGRPQFVGMHGSVVARDVTHFLVAFDVPRRTGKRLHFHLTTLVA